MELKLHNELSSLVKQSTDISRHFFDLSGVELFDFSHHTNVSFGDKVDGYTLSTETTTSTDSVDVVFLVRWQVVVDDQRDLLDIDTSSQQVGSNQDTGGTRSEFLHDCVSFGLGQVGVDGRDSEVFSLQLGGQEFDLRSGVTEDNGLGDGDGVVQVTQTVELVVFQFDVDVELLDTFQGQFVLLDQDSDRVVHELGGDFQHILRHSGRQQDDLGSFWQQTENVVDLFLETRR